MKQAFFLLSIFLLISCNSNSPTETNSEKTTISPPQTEPKSLDWLLGSWKRTNDKEGNQTFENWEKISSEEYHGLGYTLSNQDTVFKEELKIMKVNEKFNLIVYAVNENPTPFQFTKHDETSFSCENQANEFPKVINYLKNGKNLEATISGGEMEIGFVFEKVK